jgi:hypothetical protein
VKDRFETLRLPEGVPLGSSRRILYAGGGSAIHRQRQKCEPGSHPLEVRGFALAHDFSPILIVDTFKNPRSTGISMV